ncbi:MAG: hypothetical protein LW847_11665 [Burkholderiales bacterium]|jgi:hypothetical protein|nr:hypothetical protein [Burkholderiales bacterium]
MSTLALTNVYLEPAQKRALARKARGNKTNLSVEVRSAIDAYLAGVTADDLKVLDAATRRVEADLADMNATLDRGLARAQDFFAEIERIRASAP